MLEALAVVAITVLVSALAYPRLDRMAQGIRYEQARVLLVADLARARGRAIATDGPTALTPDPGGAGYARADGTHVALPAALRIARADGGDAVRFRADGSAEPAEFVLAGPTYRARIQLDPATGLLADAR